MTTQLHKEHLSWEGGQCKKMCCIVDVDGVDLSEFVCADVPPLPTVVFEEASDQTGLARSKRMLLFTQGI